jgi:ribosomal protein L20
MRVKGGTVTHRRHKKVTDAAKGYYGRRSNTFKVARQAVDKANQYATRDRHNRKRNFRALWIQRINAAVRSIDETLTYSRLERPLHSGRPFAFVWSHFRSSDLRNEAIIQLRLDQ